MIQLKNITKLFAAGDVQTKALDNINFEIEQGEYVAITGPSGCGKSTLLGILGLLDTPHTGEYWLEGVNVAAMSEPKLNRLRRGRIGFIFQNFNLIDELSVAENVGLALEYAGLGVGERKERVGAMLERLAIAHRANHRPSQLSGGQQQRVAIARALAARPVLLLADEPTGNLDSAHGDEVMAMLEAINAEGITVVMVTHSRAHAARAGRILNLLDGKIESDTRRAYEVSGL